MQKTRCHSAQYIEPLERRQLLSGVSLLAQPDVTMARTESVQLVERDVADDDETDTPIPVQNVPVAVRTALGEQFPGAELIDASFSADDAEFDLNAWFAGRQISVAFQASGAVTEAGESVSLSELPRAVFHWVKQNMPSGQIVEAELVTKGEAVTYELVVGTAGQPKYDITLKVLDAPRSSGVNHPDPVLPDSAAPTSPALKSAPAAQLYDETIPHTATAERANTDAPSPGLGSASRRGVELEPRLLDQQTQSQSSAFYFIVLEILPATAIKLVSNDNFLAGVLRGLAVQGPSTGSLALATALAEVVSIDFRVAELRLQQAAKAIDSLVGELVATGATQSVTWRVALLGALITAGQLVLHIRRQTGQAPLLVRSAANSSWSWVIGTPPGRRNRQ